MGFARMYLHKFFFLWCVMQTFVSLIVFFPAAAAIKDRYEGKEEFPSFRHVNMIAQEWKQKPFASLISTPNEQCPDGYKLAFSRTWYGSNVGCDCRGVVKPTEGSVLYTPDDYRRNWERLTEKQICDSNLESAGCKTLQAHPPVVMGKFRGKRICGKETGASFIEAVRPDLTGACPEGYRACNPGSDPDNISCLPLENKSLHAFQKACPIN